MSLLSADYLRSRTFASASDKVDLDKKSRRWILALDSIDIALCHSHRDLKPGLSVLAN